MCLSDQILISQEDAQILEINEEFTLMNWWNAILLNKKVENDIVISIKLRLHIDGDYKLTKNKISWMSITGAIMN